MVAAKSRHCHRPCSLRERRVSLYFNKKSVVVPLVMVPWYPSRSPVHKNAVVYGCCSPNASIPGGAGLQLSAAVRAQRWRYGARGRSQFK